MRRSCSASLSLALVVLAVVLGWPWPRPALAHKVVVFATCTGKTIDGEVYFHGGTAARNVKVTLAGPEGQVLGETTTDDEGRFTFPVHFRCDHKVIADAGGGHGAEYTVPADELPESLPRPGSGDQAVGATAEEAEPRPLAPDDAETPTVPRASDQGAFPQQSDEQAFPAPAREGPVAAPPEKDLRAETEAIAHQLAALRRDLNEYENELRLRDVLGGLGYILGIMGVVFYFLGVRRKEKRSASTDAPIGS
jgi:nickel transport protein